MSLAWPAFLANAFQTTVDWFTLWALGSLGGNALAVFGIGRTVVNWAGAALWALGLGTMVLVARAVGADDDERVRKTVVQSLVFTLGITLIVAAICMSATGPLVRAVANDAVLVSESVRFLRAFLFSMVTMVMIYLVLSILRGAGESKLAMRLQILTNSVQALLVWGLTFGAGPFPKLGVTGVAAGIALARVIGVSATVGVFLSGRCRVRISMRDLLTYRPDFTVLREIIGVSAPNGGEAVAKSTGRMVIMRIISATASASSSVAAYTVGSQIESLYEMIGSSFGVASATSVGQNLGADRPFAARAECHRSAQYGMYVAVTMGVTIMLLAPQLMGLFSQDPEVIRSGSILLRALGFSAPFYMLMVVYCGGLKGAADTRTPMLISIMGTWLIQIPFALAAISLLKLDTAGIWISEAINYVAQGVVAYTVFKKGAWIRARV